MARHLYAPTFGVKLAALCNYCSSLLLKSAPLSKDSLSSVIYSLNARQNLTPCSSKPKAEYQSLFLLCYGYWLLIIMSQTSPIIWTFI